MDCNSVQVLTTDPALVSCIVDIISAVIYAVLAVVAIYGINSWRREYRGKRQMELAEDVLALFYEAKDTISAIRSPYSHEGEGSTRKAVEKETPEEKEVRDRAYTVWERYKKNIELFSKLHSIRYRFMAQVGVKESEPFEQIRHIISEILASANTLSLLWAKPSIPRTPQKEEELYEKIKKYEAVFWWQGSEDAIDKRVDKAIVDIEKTCKKIIGQK